MAIGNIPGFTGNNFFDQSFSPFFPPFFPPFFNLAVLIVRVGTNFFQVFVIGSEAQAIQITPAQAALLQQFGIPLVVLC